MTFYCLSKAFSPGGFGMCSVPSLTLPANPCSHVRLPYPACCQSLRLRPQSSFTPDSFYLPPDTHSFGHIHKPMTIHKPVELLRLLHSHSVLCILTATHPDRTLDSCPSLGIPSSHSLRVSAQLHKLRPWELSLTPHSLSSCLSSLSLPY